jgi:hypothetical protein
MLALMSSRDAEYASVRAAGNLAVNKLTDRVATKNDINCDLSRILTRQKPTRISMLLESAKRLPPDQRRKVAEWLVDGGGLAVDVEENRQLLRTCCGAEPDSYIDGMAAKGTKTAQANKMSEMSMPKEKAK